MEILVNVVESQEPSYCGRYAIEYTFCNDDYAKTFMLNVKMKLGPLFRVESVKHDSCKIIVTYWEEEKNIQNAREYVEQNVGLIIKGMESSE